MSDGHAGFRPGFASRHALAAQVLQQAFAVPDAGFAPADPRQRSDTASAPRHFSPADPSSNPTQGWDPLDPQPVDTPFIDPLAAAHAAGYAEGLAAALVGQAEAGSRDRTMLAAIAEQLRGVALVNREAIAEQLRRTVMLLVTRLVGEIGIDADRLAGRIAAAADLLADGAESALLRVHPDDVALLDGHLPRAVFAAGDASVARGHFVLESASTIVEDGPDLWLEQLAQAIDRVAVPGAPC